MASTLDSAQMPQPSYEDPDTLLLPHPTSASYMMTAPQPACEDLDASEPIYEDLDALLAAVPDESQSEAKAKPDPCPRTKFLPKAQCVSGSNDASDSEDKTNSTTHESSQNAEDSPEYKRPQPVRPAPEPPKRKHLSSSKPSATENQYTTSQPSVKPPAVYGERTKSAASRPARPPPPSIYYGRTTSHKGETGTQSESNCEESKPPTYSPTSSKLDPVSSASPEAALGLNGTYTETGTERKPAVPPRPWQLGDSLSQAPTAPALLPRPPSLVRDSDECPYLEILPSESRTTQRRTTLSPEQTRQSHRGAKEDTEEAVAKLRWLKKVSRPDYMTPSVYGLSIEEEIRSFEQRAANVNKALRLFNLLMMKRNDKMRLIIADFTSISDSLDKLQKKTKTMGIAGGTAGAVGGMTAVVGIALAPVTLGASLIATAVGAGMVASAGGMSAHRAKANKRIVNRTTVEELVDDYQANVVDLEHCLDFIMSGMNELLRHDIARLQRAGAPLEAVRTAHQSQSVVNNMNGNTRTSIAPTGGTSSERQLLAFSKEMDQYFTEKNYQKLKKLNKSKFSGRVRLLAQNLQDDLDHLNHMWELFN